MTVETTTINDEPVTAAPQSVPQPLITKYRPRDWAEMFGHEDVLRQITRSIDTDTHPHAYLLTGKSGLGKTTIARLLAKHFDAEVLEVDAATSSGVDEMRDLVEMSLYNPFSASGKRMIIIDECHALSKNAWQALLKITEEPPPHLYFAFCTTEEKKVPSTLHTRCYPIALRPVPKRDIEELVLAISDAEGWEVNGDVLGAIVSHADGSPRQAINDLQAVQGITSRDEVKRILTLMEISDPVKDLCQAMLRISGKELWTAVRNALEQIPDDEYENASTLMCRYFAGVMQNSKSEADAVKAWNFLECLIQPVQSWDKKAILYAALGRAIWSNG